MADVPTLLIALATVAGGGTLLATHSGELPSPPPSAEQATIAGAPSAATLMPSAHTPRRTVLQRQDDGLFYVDAMVNGTKVRFLIDTGSNMVVLSRQDAARAGVSAGESTGSLNTAGGTTSGAVTRIGRISVAGRDLRNVSAAIPSAGLDVSLLGQNVLSELGEVRIGRATLTVG